jgi:hypothetical protein
LASTRSKSSAVTWPASGVLYADVRLGHTRTHHTLGQRLEV